MRFRRFWAKEPLLLRNIRKWPKRATSISENALPPIEPEDSHTTTATTAKIVATCVPGFAGRMRARVDPCDRASVPRDESAKLGTP